MTMTVVPWGNVPEIVWDDENEEHIAAHGVTPDEIESVLEQGEYTVRPHPKKRKGEKYLNRYLLEGRTIGGKFLFVVVDHVEGSRIRPVTAI